MDMFFAHMMMTMEIGLLRVFTMLTQKAERSILTPMMTSISTDTQGALTQTLMRITDGF